MKRLLLMAAAFIQLSSSSCASMHSQEDLSSQVFHHHNNLRWGRLGNAATLVIPEMREAFMKHWAANAGRIELQDIEVAGLVVDDKTNTANVVLNVTYIERETMMVKTVQLSEVWKRTDSGWLVEKPAELE